MTDCINTYASTYHEKSLRLINLHKVNSTEVSSTVEAIKTEFLAQLEKFVAAQKSNSTDAKKTITNQANELEHVRNFKFLNFAICAPNET